MNTYIAFIFSSLAGLSTMIGSFVVFCSKKKTLNFLIGGISFAAGVMFFLSIFDLVPESLRFFSDSFKIVPSIIICLIFLSLGVCVSIIVDKFFPSTFDNDNLYKIGLITMIGLMIHNIPEGIATFMTTNEDVRLGLSTSISITMHNIPEGISIALPIYYCTKSKGKAFLYTFICAASEPFGALLAYLFLNPTYFTLGIIYSITSGIMIYISMYELFSSVIKYKRYRIVYTFYIVGFSLVLINHFLV